MQYSGFSAGTRASLRELVGRADLNGTAVELLHWKEDAGRWAVRCLSTGEGVCVRPVNLVVEENTKADRLRELLQLLRQSSAGSESRRTGVVDLEQLLLGSAEWSAEENKAILETFEACHGAKLLCEMESSMSGDWMTDARNGTTQRLGQLMKVPGEIGAAISSYRDNLIQEVDKAVHDAHNHHSHHH